MNSQQENNAHGTLDSMAENLKSGVANAPESVFGETMKAADTMADKAEDIAGNVVDLAAATQKAAKKAAGDIEKTASAAKSKAVAGAKEIAKDASDEALSLQAAFEEVANNGIARVKNNVVNNPLKSVAIAAAFGYLAAVILRA